MQNSTTFTTILHVKKCHLEIPNPTFLGKHITIVAHSRAVEISLQAANELSSKGIEAEVINLRSLRPLDVNTVTASVAKTNHLITVEQGWPSAGIGAEILARIMESEAFFHLDQPAIRLTGVDTPMPYTKSLEIAALPVPRDVVDAAKKLLKVK
jgi:pyruvate dehydrogenase E1 component beta subunit